MIKQPNGKRNTLLFACLILLMSGLFLADILSGPVSIPIKSILASFIGKSPLSAEWSTIVFSIRFPKAITAVLAGMALSVSGLQMQTVFRNPLAGPDVLGISAGASLGVAILVMGFSWFSNSIQTSLFTNLAIAMGAWIGSGALLFLVLVISLRVKDIMTILILGIMFGSASYAIVSILQFFSSETTLKAFVVWTLGSLGSVSHEQLNILFPSIAAGLILAFLSTKTLNLMLLGETYATSLGLNIKRSRFVVFLSTSLLAGSITAFCGPIGFIGIAVPHLTRIIFKTAEHRVLITGCILVGASVMLLSDILCQLPGSGVNLPINSVTAIIGVPIVIWLIVKNYKLSSFA
jgi:iron complex transport system permease protein